MVNVLAVSQELAEQGYPKMIEIPEAAFYALIGFAIVFMGITFLIGVVWAVGKLMQMKNGTPIKTSVQTKSVDSSVVAPVVSSASDEIDEETVAVITAAIMAYYEQTNGPKCEFRVKRIKRI